MKPTNQNWLDEKLQLSYDDKEDKIWIESSYTLRIMIGVLGMLLPIFLWLFLLLATDRLEVLPSISHYYFTRVDGIFMIIIGLLAMFLIFYKGKERIDFYTSLIAGISALIVLLFPTDALTLTHPDANVFYSNTVLPDSNFRENLHYLAAALFIGSLAFMSLKVFTLSNKPKGERGKMKNIRNTIYKICGIIMILAMVVIAGKLVGIIDADLYDNNNLTFWMETIAVEAFGFSWLVKGETLFKDR